jgi:hypothetical protein
LERSITVDLLGEGLEERDIITDANTDDFAADVRSTRWAMSMLRSGRRAVFIAQPGEQFQDPMPDRDQRFAISRQHVVSQWLSVHFPGMRHDDSYAFASTDLLCVRDGVAHEVWAEATVW